MKIIEYELKNLSICYCECYNESLKCKCNTISNAFYGKFRSKKYYNIEMQKVFKLNN